MTLHLFQARWTTKGILTNRKILKTETIRLSAVDNRPIWNIFKMNYAWYWFRFETELWPNICHDHNKMFWKFHKLFKSCHVLNLWRPLGLLPCEYCYKASCARPVPSFVIEFLTSGQTLPGCQKLQMTASPGLAVWPRMLYSCTRMSTVGRQRVKTHNLEALRRISKVIDDLSRLVSKLSL